MQTTALGNGLTLKAGRFFSGIGYLNPQHAHTWDFVDAPLAYQAMLGAQYGDDGLQLQLAGADRPATSSWAPRSAAGAAFPAATRSRNGAGAASLALHTGGDIGDSHSWRAGVSLSAAPRPTTRRCAGSTPATRSSTACSAAARASGSPTRSGSGRRTATPRAPTSSCRANTCTARAAARWSTTPRGANLPATTAPSQSGWYLQGDLPVHAALARRACAPSGSTPARRTTRRPRCLAADGYQPRKNSLMLDFSPSEFSRLRLQFARDRARTGVADNQWFLQYQMSLGAHGAHGF